MQVTKTLTIHTSSKEPLSEKSYFHFGQFYLSNVDGYIQVGTVEVTFEIDLPAVVSEQVNAITKEIDSERTAFHLKVTALEAARNNLLCLEA